MKAGPSEKTEPREFRPYQSFPVKGHSYKGKHDTVAQFVALDLTRQLKGASFLDLGCNMGGLVFLAEQAGASRAVGVERLPELHKTSLDIKSAHGMKSEFVNHNLLDYSTEEKFDFVTCMAVVRHLFKQLAEREQPEVRADWKILHANPMDVLIRRASPYGKAVYDRYDALVARLISFAARRCIVSYRDPSGLIARRSDEVGDYIRSICGDHQVEVFQLGLDSPYVGVSIKK